MTQPTKFTWDDALSTGDPRLDSQHKVLIDIFNDLADIIESGADKASVAKILLALKHYAGRHFNREEDCMDKYQCPMIAINKKAHAYFEQRLQNYEQELETVENMAEFALQVHENPARWIYNHILEVDATLYHSIYSTNISMTL